MSRQERVRAAQYLRMSTEHQRYSSDNQASEIAAFALKRGFEVVATYADNGISGLKLSNRKGLKQLLADVIGGQARFDAVLVYDVSRWGRFQNPDQSAHYEFLCAEAGVEVVYCAEPFSNDGSLGSTLIKSLKRAMAAEYSRELSNKVAIGKRRVARKGYWVSGQPGYGLRRHIVDDQDRLVAKCEKGQRKAYQGYRTVIAPGPPEEVKVVRRIFRLYAITGLSKKAIARQLNTEGVPAEGGAKWSISRVNHLLHNPKYVGELVYGRKTTRLGGAPSPVPQASWLRVRGALRPIVDRSLFAAAQRVAADQVRLRSDEDFLDTLRQVFLAHGRITGALIDAWPGAPASETYRRRFGSLKRAAQLVGCDHAGWSRVRYADLDDEQILARMARLLVREGRINAPLISQDSTLPSASALSVRFGSLHAAYARIGYVQSCGPNPASPLLVARREVMAERARAWAELATG
jgi:DNA invertase Pin-like site-specific DNA recombinase